MSADIDSIKRKLLIKYPTFGSIIANLEFQANKDVGTAGTDGKVVLYNPNFLNGLSDKEQIFLFAHEICHVAFEHIFRSEGKDKKLWNIATDSVINALLQQDGLPMVEGGVDIPEAVNYDAEEMYNKLLEEKKQQEQQNSQGQQEQQNSQGQQEQQNSQGQQEQQNSQGQQEQQNSQGQQEQQNSQGQQEQQNSQGQQGQQNSQGQQEQQDSQGQQGEQNSQGQQEQQNSQGQQEQQNSQGQQEQQNSQGQQEQQNSQGQQGQQNSQGQQEQQDSQGQQGEQEETDIGHDTHSLWDKAIEERKKEQEEQAKKEENTQITDKDKKEEQSPVKKEDKFAEQGEQETFRQNKIERRKQLQELSKELASKSSHDEAGDGIQREEKRLSDIGIAIPLIDWRRLLRQAVKYEEEWTRKNARMRDGYFRHRIEQIPMPETEILLDTSGSVSEVLLKNFLRECKNILDNSKVKVGCFDTEFHGFTELRRPEDIDQMNFPIGGGTDFDVAVGAFSRRVPNKIIFTDGEAIMPEKAVRDVIWVVFGNEQINPKGGKVINITGEQLRKLYQQFIKENTNER